MRIAAVILNWNQARLTEKAAQSVAGQVDQVILVDNGSRPDDVELLATLAAADGTTLLRHDRNLGYAGGNNPAIAQAVSEGFEGILVMNNDAIAEPGAVAALARRLEENPRLGAVQPMVTDLYGRRVFHTHCTMDLERGNPRWVGNGLSRDQVSTEPRESGYISGEAFLAQARVFETVGGFDERYGMYFEDTEWSLRVRRAGWMLGSVPEAVFRHEWGSSLTSAQGAFLWARGRVLFYRLAFGAPRLVALWRSLPTTARQVRWALLRGKVWHALRGELAGTMAGFLAAPPRPPA
jgi:GT2 family glycosyltransferase